jgi:uncharacterized damage-inducible protein DinB
MRIIPREIELANCGKGERMSTVIGKPTETEYLSYYDSYISLVPDGNIVTILAEQIEETLALLDQVDEAQAGYRYEPDKWSIRELVGHVIDSERVFAYRALRFARGDQTALAGYEQDDYVANGSFDNTPLKELRDELEAVRRATTFLFKHLEQDAWMRIGIANDANVSVRALAYMIAGHELHHRGVLQSRYLNRSR